MAEVRAVIQQIEELVASKPNNRVIKYLNIGVVTPYKLQCKIISRHCNRLNFSNITVGTAEIFQRQEKPIMILSTVRTGGVLGFVTSAQVRFQ